MSVLAHWFWEADFGQLTAPAVVIYGLADVLFFAGLLWLIGMGSGKP